MPAIARTNRAGRGFHAVRTGYSRARPATCRCSREALAQVDSKVPAIYRRISVKYWLIAALTFVVVFVGVVVVAVYRRARGDRDETHGSAR